MLIERQRFGFPSTRRTMNANAPMTLVTLASRVTHT